MKRESWLSKLKSKLKKADVTKNNSDDVQTKTGRNYDDKVINYLARKKNFGER